MKVLLFVVCALLAATGAAAQQGPPSDESVSRLLAATHADRILDQYMNQLDAGMQAGMRQALKDQKPTAKQQQVIDEMRGRIVAVMRETLSWNKLEPTIHELYRSNLTQGEVDGMVKFYESPTGRAVIDKLPAIMQQAGQAVQAMLPPLLAQLDAIMKDSVAKLQAAGND